METYDWDVLATFHWDFVGCFIWDVPVTSLGSCYVVAWMSCCRMGIYLPPTKICLIFHLFCISKTKYHLILVHSSKEFKILTYFNLLAPCSLKNLSFWYCTPHILTKAWLCEFMTFYFLDSFCTSINMITLLHNFYIFVLIILS